MHPDAEGHYSTRLLTCHACSEQGKAQADLRDANTEPGIHIAVYRT
jgi:hypothetical protein